MKHMGTRRERGQNLVEFALVLPVLVFLMLGGYTLGLLWLRLSDTAYIAQSAATMAARYGGNTPELKEAVTSQVANSFLAGDAANFTWRVETRSAEGELLCGGPKDDARVECQCNWGEQVTVVTTYRWKVSVLLLQVAGTYDSPKTALCWRGTANGGE